MEISVTIHEAWLARPEDLRKVMALLAALEGPPPQRVAGDGWRVERVEARPPVRFRHPPPVTRRPRWPGRAAPARKGPDRGDAWEPEAHAEEACPPADGGRLLGWASKQVPDMKGMLIGYGKKKGLHTKIVEWSPQQVAAAYRFTRARSTR